MAENKTKATEVSVTAYIDAIEDETRREESKVLVKLLTTHRLFPAKAAYSLYGFTGTEGADELLVKLGKHTTGKSCLYVKKLKDVDLKILEALAANALAARKTN